MAGPIAENGYFMLAGPSQGEYKEKGSKFLGYAFPVTDEDEVKEKLDEVRKQHPKARHHCYAFRLGTDGALFRVNDDGEPSGTAGRPILGQIDRLNLTRTLVVVVRYFGGTLLGTSGLIRAYRAGAADALSNGRVVEKRLRRIYRAAIPYEKFGAAMEMIKQFDGEVLEQQFGQQPLLTIAFEQRRCEEALTALKAEAGNITRDEARRLEQVPGLTLTYLETR